MAAVIVVIIFLTDDERAGGGCSAVVFTQEIRLARAPAAPRNVDVDIVVFPDFSTTTTPTTPTIVTFTIVVVVSGLITATTDSRHGRRLCQGRKWGRLGSRLNVYGTPDPQDEKSRGARRVEETMTKAKAWLGCEMASGMAADNKEQGSKSYGGGKRACGTR